MEQALVALEDIGLPAIVRPSFTLGGSGGGIAYTKEEFVDIVKNGLRLSPTNEVLIDESILGWKEYEMEVVRDKADNSNHCLCHRKYRSDGYPHGRQYNGCTCFDSYR